MKIIEGTITSHFGGRRDPIEGAYKVHQGIDIAAPIGTTIYSPTRGSVAAVYTNPQGGLTLILRSECGLIRYGMCHLSKVLVEEGDEIKAGDAVAKSGNSGRTTGPHLHYSVKCGGKWHAGQYIGGSFVDSEEYVEFTPDE